MREIKYKVWDKENNKWYEPTYKAYVGKLEYLVLNMDGSLSMMKNGQMIHDSKFPNRFILVLFTGLHDKNGKEIYEGDIIRHDSAGVGVVEYDNDNYSFQMNISSAVLDQECSPEGKKMEIIGNIYENPEILEERS